MRVLGINCTSRHALLAVVEAGVVLPGLPELLEIPNAMTLNSDLTSFRDEVRRRLTQIGPERVAVLFAETVSKGAHTSWMPRLAAETAIRMVAADLGVHAELIARPTVRSLLDVPQKGKLDTHVSSVLPSAVGKHWTAGRNLAALAALAVERRG
jgi:hypothetical protein